MAGTLAMWSLGTVGARSTFRVCASHPSLLGGVGESRSLASAGQVLPPSATAFGNGTPDMGAPVALLACPDTMDQDNYWRSTE